MRVLSVLFVAVLGCLSAYARPVCVGEMCYPSEQAALAAGVSREAIEKALREDHSEEGAPVVEVAPKKASGDVRLAMGYMKPEAMTAFLRNQPSGADALENHALIVVLLLILAGGCSRISRPACCRSCP